MSGTLLNALHALSHLFFTRLLLHGDHTQDQLIHYAHYVQCLGSRILLGVHEHVIASFRIRKENKGRCSSLDVSLHTHTAIKYNFLFTKFF